MKRSFGNSSLIRLQS